MPHGPRIADAHVLAVFLLRRDDQDIGIPGEMRVTLGRMFIERAKPPRKVDVLLRGQVLVPEDEDMMVPARDCFLAAAAL